MTTDYGFKTLLSDGDSNAKLAKSNASGLADDDGRPYLTYGLSLAPAETSGYNVCQQATAGCKSTCLFVQGRGALPSNAAVRVARTRFFFEQQAQFRMWLFRDIAAAQSKADRKGMRLAVRLNVLSDLPWERIMPELFEAFPHVQFYDYTKVLGRTTLPANYHLTYSRSESNDAGVLQLLAEGRNVAVVFQSKDLPTSWHGYDVINGDETDLRFLDRKGVVVGLYAKGTAKGNVSGFVVDNRPAGIIQLRKVG